MGKTCEYRVQITAGPVTDAVTDSGAQLASGIQHVWNTTPKEKFKILNMDIIKPA